MVELADKGWYKVGLIFEDVETDFGGMGDGKVSKSTKIRNWMQSLSDRRK